MFPMAGIALDLIGPFLPMSQGNERILSCIDLLTHYLFLVPILDKQVDTVITAYVNHIFSEAGGSFSILSDSGSEFTAGVFKKIMSELGLRQVFTSPRTPSGNAVLERAHSFVKDKLTRLRTMLPSLEWDQLVQHVKLSYNIMPMSATHEAPFFLFYGRDPYLLTLHQLLKHKVRYYGSEKGGLMMDTMTLLYQETVTDLIKARQSKDPKISNLRGDMFNINDIVFLKDHNQMKLAPRFNKTYQITKLVGDKMVDLVDPAGQVRRATFAQLKKTTPIDSLLSRVQVDMTFGRRSKYLSVSLPPIMKKIMGEPSSLTTGPSVSRRPVVPARPLKTATKVRTTHYKRKLKHGYQNNGHGYFLQRRTSPPDSHK